MADFVKNVFVKQGKYGTKISFKVDAFIEELKSKKNSSGYVNIEIKESKSGDKMYAQYDDWEPKKGSGAPAQNSRPAPAPKSAVQNDDDGLPF
jgi:hypothetical protein